MDYTTIFQGVLTAVIIGFLGHSSWLKKRDKNSLDELSSRVTKLETTAIDQDEARWIARDELVSLEKETKVLEKEITALKISIDKLTELITLLRIELAANKK